MSQRSHLRSIHLHKSAKCERKRTRAYESQKFYDYALYDSDRSEFLFVERNSFKKWRFIIREQMGSEKILNSSRKRERFESIRKNHLEFIKAHYAISSNSTFDRTIMKQIDHPCFHFNKTPNYNQKERAFYYVNHRQNIIKIMPSFIERPYAYNHLIFTDEQKRKIINYERGYFLFYKLWLMWQDDMVFDECYSAHDFDDSFYKPSWDTDDCQMNAFEFSNQEEESGKSVKETISLHHILWFIAFILASFTLFGFMNNNESTESVASHSIM